MKAPAGFDPVTLNHWLWFKYQCHEGSAADFQRLFENIIKRAKPEFMQIRPYGNIGDRKCDGLLHANSTVFQVYSPDELKLSELKKKINEDLEGAARHWQATLTDWIFVYNARRGLAPDVPSLLVQKQKEYPDIKIDHLSSDALWEMLRDLTLQQRAEILGAPVGYEHLFLNPAATSEEVQAYLESAWFVLIQDMLSPISIPAVVDALRPDTPFGAPILIRPVVREVPWDEAAKYQRHLVAEALQKSRDIGLARFAVFSLAPIPLMIHLGFLLSDRVEVRYFQFDRDRRSWRWQTTDVSADCNIQVSGLPTKQIDADPEVLIRVSLSAKIHKRDTDAVVPSLPVEIDLSVENPDVMWLRSSEQIFRLGQTFRQVLGNLRSFIPGCQHIHLFYAGPAAGAIIIGQQINPRMNPPVTLYQYSQ